MLPGKQRKGKDNRTHGTETQLESGWRSKVAILRRNLSEHGKHENAYKKRTLPQSKGRAARRNMDKHNRGKCKIDRTKRELG